jgi:hypothetical protein
VSRIEVRNVSIVAATGYGLLAVSIAFAVAVSARAVERPPLTIEAKIPLGDVRVDSNYRLSPSHCAARVCAF